MASQIVNITYAIGPNEFVREYGGGGYPVCKTVQRYYFKLAKQKDAARGSLY